MRPAPEITAWRAHAPWRSDAQVEQDLLLAKSMVAIFRDPFLGSQVAMRGGTVLHKLHLAPASRYSEDIDLVLVGDSAPGHVQKAILRTLEPILGRPRSTIVRDVRLASSNAVKEEIVEVAT